MPEVYVPIAQDRVLSFVMVVKTDGAPMAHAAAVRAVILAADPDAPVTRIMSLDDRIATTTANVRFGARLMSTFATIALVLAAIGVYGVLAYTVSQRRREFGVRAAIGATRRRVVGMVLSDALKLSVLAIAIGTVGALALGRTVSGLLFGVTPGDPRRAPSP